ncbi:MAG: 30S ribosomal protein S20 [Dehalococcoidia bacterium]|nr:30S ribosomal protein S20 [Dehalococcoidia bacterium]MCA9845637.1 30S ribosomal protein S20 [Dehalococcoidia bacterium]
MANIKSSIKRWHQSLKRRDRNRSRRTTYRNAVRSVREAVAAGDLDKANQLMPAAFSALDRAAKTGAIHAGTADRGKRRLANLVNKAS